MERSEISIQEVRIFETLLREKTRWLSNHELFSLTEGVGRRTVRATTHKLVELNLLDQAEIHPGHRFRLSSMAEKRNKAYWDRLHFAAEVLGVAL